MVDVNIISLQTAGVVISGTPPSLVQSGGLLPGSGHGSHSWTLLVFSLEIGDLGKVLKQPEVCFILAGLVFALGV